MSEQAENAFNRVQTARHPERPYTLDLLSAIFTEFVEIHGDRRYSDDAALICGFAKLGEKEVVVVGQQKGRDLNQRRFRNFGMPKPEGYRKALRAMKLGEKFGRPIITFIDTPGAYPGIDAEERGQAEAIAYNLREMANLRVPVIVVVLGEGGSGGALAIGVGDWVLMLENAVYSVITPEGCAAILWKDAAEASRAAECLRLTASNLKRFGLIDEIVSETVEWQIAAEKSEEKIAAKILFDETSDKLRKALVSSLDKVSALDEQERRKRRYKKFRKMGQWILKDDTAA